MDTRQFFLDRHAAVYARTMQPQGWWKEEDTICADITEEQLRDRPHPPAQFDCLALVASGTL